MFSDRLQVALALTIGSDSFDIAAGSIEAFTLTSHPWGFDAEVTFYVSSELEEDAVFARFTTRDLTRAKLTVMSGVVQPDDEDAQPIVATGYVTSKRLRESVSPELEGEPIFARSYTITFADPARVFWRQHHLLELSTDTSMGDLLELHKAPGMVVKRDWGRLDQKEGMLCLAASADSPASFYDLVVGFVANHNGVMEHDGKTGTYRFGKAKATALKPTPIAFEDIEGITILAPEPRRHTTHVLNPRSDLPQTKPAPSTDSVLGVRRDLFAYTPIAAAFDLRLQTEIDRIRPGEHGLAITFQRCPDRMPYPGATAITGDDFSPKLFPNHTVYRVIGFTVEAVAKTADESDPNYEEPSLDEETATFVMSMGARLEHTRDPTPRLPSFTPGAYPIYVEGRVVSASGGDDDRTWFTSADEATSIYETIVDIPLWNKKVKAAFTPGKTPGHFFFPPYKNQRVLVALSFDAAHVAAFLDWAPNAKPAKDSQGNTIAMGYAESNGTTLSHTFVDAKPKLTVERKLGNDVQTIVMREGVISMKVEELKTVAKVEPKYDVSPQVAAAKERIAGQVMGSITAVTGAFETSAGGVTAALDEATADVDASLTAAETALVAKIEAVEGELKTLVAGTSTAVAELAAKITEAKAAILAALFG